MGKQINTLYTLGAVASALLGIGTQAQAAPALPQAPQVQYISTAGATSGGLVQVEWVKWWGASGNQWQLLRNNAVVCEGTLTLDPKQDPNGEQRASCVAYLGAGDNQFSARLCQDEVCATSAPYPLSVPATAANAAPAQWDAAAIYQKGDQVAYQGLVYQAQYWVQGELPTNPEPWRQIANAKVSSASAKVTDWKNGATAAYSILFDDYCAWVNDAGLILGEKELAQRKLAGNFGVIAGFCGDPAWSGHWPNLKAFIQRGHEVFNHSWDHGHPGDAPWAERKWAGNELEIRQSTQKMADMLDGYQPTFYSFPFDTAKDDQLAFLKSMPQYLGTRAPNYWQAGGVNPKDFADPFFSRFYVYSNAAQGEANPESLHNYLAATVQNEGWGVRVFHSVEDSFYESVPLAQYQSHLDEVKGLVDGGKLWVGTVSDVIRYRFARGNCGLKPAQQVAQGLLYSFDNQSAGCAKYASPLTLEITLADHAPVVAQGGRALAVTQVRAGVFQAQVDPRRGDVLVR